VVLARHGETEWSLSGQHTGTTDLPLTDEGRRQAQALAPRLAGREFALVLSSPLGRALETCRLAGLGDVVQVREDLREWDYGDYEGMTTTQIQERAPGWYLFDDGCPHGESAEDVGARADRVVAELHAADGDAAVFGHGHCLRVLAAPPCPPGPSASWAESMGARRCGAGTRRREWRWTETAAGEGGGGLSAEVEKRVAAAEAAELVEDGMVLGLGTGSTVAFLLPALAARGLSLRCVATSPQTEAQARELCLLVESFDAIERFDLAIDGADQIAPDGWLVKGGGAAHTREKVVAAAADRFVVIGDGSKLVEAIDAPVPLELLSYGLAATLRELGSAQVREGAGPSPDGNVIADYTGEVGDPATLSARLSAVPGLVEHGLFPPSMVSEIIVGHGETVERRSIP
jgi:ribose 5-phosphate isomerase A